MKELIIALVYSYLLRVFLYAIFPSKMKNILRKLELIPTNQLRIGGLIFAVIGFIIIYYIKS